MPITDSVTVTAIDHLVGALDAIVDSVEDHGAFPTVTEEAFTQSAEVTEIYSALVEAQNAIQNVTTDRTADVRMRNGGNYAYRYATLANVLAIARPALADQGCAIMQSPLTPAPGKVTVATRVIHRSGQWVETRVSIDPVNGAASTPQEVGSAITYARRYGVSALLSIASENDDDGAQASQRDAAPSAPAPAPTVFDDPNRPDGLVSRDDLTLIHDQAHALPTDIRRELTAWREAEGITINPDMTADDAAKVLARIAEVDPARQPSADPEPVAVAEGPTDEEFEAALDTLVDVTNDLLAGGGAVVADEPSESAEDTDAVAYDDPVAPAPEGDATPTSPSSRRRPSRARSADTKAETAE